MTDLFQEGGTLCLPVLEHGRFGGTSQNRSCPPSCDKNGAKDAQNPRCKEWTETEQAWVCLHQHVSQVRRTGRKQQGGEEQMCTCGTPNKVPASVHCNLPDQTVRTMETERTQTPRRDVSHSDPKNL